MGDDVGEAELAGSSRHLGIQLDRLEREARRRVEREHAVERATTHGIHRVVEATDELGDVREPVVQGVAAAAIGDPAVPERGREPDRALSPNPCLA